MTDLDDDFFYAPMYRCLIDVKPWKLTMVASLLLFGWWSTR